MIVFPLKKDIVIIEVVALFREVDIIMYSYLVYYIFAIVVLHLNKKYIFPLETLSSDVFVYK